MEPSAYVRRIQADIQDYKRTGMTGPQFPTGLQVPTTEDAQMVVVEVDFVRDGQVEIAMAAAFEDLGLESRTLVQVKRRADWPRLWVAMLDEQRRWEENEVMVLVDLPPDANILDVGWVYAYKREALGGVFDCRARVLVKGFAQIEGVDYFDTSVPVAKITSIRICLSLAARYEWPVASDGCSQCLSEHRGSQK